ncbi:MAG TPA: zinc-dependent metalloprotease [Herpetosiphonaceae bacterium]
MKKKSNLKQLGSVLLISMAAGAGARYVANKTRSQDRQRFDYDTPQELIDWKIARTIALRVAQWEQYPVKDRAGRQALYNRQVAQSQPLIDQYLSVTLPEALSRVHVVDRREWIEANIRSFTHLFKPIEELYRNAARKAGRNPQITSINRAVVGMQVGGLIGILARKVLGQYDLSLLSPKAEPGSLYFVEPNISLIQENLGVNADEFRLWITLHETTHAYEFEAYPWVREHFQGLIRRYFSEMEGQLEQIRNGIGTYLNRIFRGKQEGDSHWIESVLTPTQRAVFNELQALMSLVEGYSNHIMNAVGREILPTFDQIESRMHQRKQNRSLFDELFNRVTGMQLKMEQYEQGEKFVNALAAHGGKELAARVWEGPEMLPTPQEIRNPQQWIDRIEGRGEVSQH